MASEGSVSAPRSVTDRGVPTQEGAAAARKDSNQVSKAKASSLVNFTELPLKTVLFLAVTTSATGHKTTATLSYLKSNVHLNK